ncbi:hypothetical protein [Natronoglomus mannanivorans]|uniref:Uncharacterized protein n=1 Tax=Natronoglomus mannanivorans TaxID=2979990 RepID=A0AAP2YYA1_9EURY|nr:hypothetical protein [Halobacteria archaeon AArc-xg1-1]
MTAGFDVRWTPEHGPPRAVVFELSEDGKHWLRVEFEWTDEQWREIGRDHVTEVACFGSDDYIAPDGPRPRPVGGEDDE